MCIIAGSKCTETTLTPHTCGLVACFTEQRQSIPVQVHPQRLGTRHQHPQPDAKLAPVDQQRLVDVLLRQVPAGMTHKTCFLGSALAGHTSSHKQCSTAVWLSSKQYAGNTYEHYTIRQAVRKQYAGNTYEHYTIRQAVRKQYAPAVQRDALHAWASGGLKGSLESS
jgi:hypothetical protein